eukprot:8211-Heterococcus_DN1.PRE.2
MPWPQYVLTTCVSEAARVGQQLCNSCRGSMRASLLLLLLRAASIVRVATAIDATVTSTATARSLKGIPADLMWHHAVHAFAVQTRAVLLDDDVSTNALTEQLHAAQRYVPCCQLPGVRDAVADDLIHASAHALREVVVVERGGVGTSLYAGFVHYSVYLICCSACSHSSAACVQHLSAYAARSPVRA